MFRFAPLVFLVVAALSLSAPARAGELTPVGLWQTVSGESRYEVSSCGGGEELCARLIWLRADARSEENLQYLNTYVVTGATKADDNKWRGTVTYEGQTISGSMKLIGEDTLRLNGCQLVFCQTLEFTRI